MTTQQERWLSVDEIAAHLGVNPDTVYKWIERKKLPAHKVGRLWKFQVSEVNEWVRAGKVARVRRHRDAQARNADRTEEARIKQTRFLRSE